MRRVTYALQFRGVAAQVAPGVLALRAGAPAGALVTTLDDDGIHARFEGDGEDEALLEARMVVRDGVFDADGSVTFAGGHAVRFRVQAGRVTPTPDAHLSHGAAVADIEGGTGRFASATGRITSNFMLSDTGELTDTQVGLLFIGPRSG